MSQHEDINEPGGLFTPPVPARNPLRETRYCSSERRSQKAKLGDLAVLSSPASQNILDEIHRELEDTQQRLVSALCTGQTDWRNSAQSSHLEGRLPGTVGRTSSLKSRFGLGARVGDAGETMSRASTSSSVTDGSRRYSAYLGFEKLPEPRDESKKKAAQASFNNTSTGLRSDLNSIDSLTTISSYDGAPRKVKVNEEEEKKEDARVEAWLQRGSFSSPPPEPDRASQSSKARSITSENPRSPLHIFPPVSPTTGKREYSSPLTSPLSPLGNGRDAYGNFIPTNTRDYFNTQSPPTSPSLQPIMEDTALKTPHSTPQMRGGGNWWNPLGIGSPGKEPSLKSKASSIRPGNSQHDTSLQRSRDKSSVASQNQRGRSPRGNNWGSQVGTVPSTAVSGARDRRSIVTDDWFDESDEDNFEGDSHRSVHPSPVVVSPVQGHFGSVKDRRSALPRQSTPTSPVSYPPSNIPLKETSKISTSHRRDLPLPTHNRSVPDLDDLWSNISSTKLSLRNAGRPETPTSQVSYEPRKERRWNTGPSTEPPRKDALPPLPIPKGISSDVSDGFKEKAAFRYHNNHPPNSRQPTAHDYQDVYPPSPTIHSTTNEAWDLASLALGESFSVYNAPRFHPSPAELRAVRAQAQSEFRTLCHAIMTQYNAEIARTERDLQYGDITQVQFENQVRFMIGNKGKALRHSAQQTGYTILPAHDEDAILAAMADEHGYAIYHNLFSTTKPALWARLETQHRLAAAPPRSGSAAASVKSRESSLDHARHVAGKIARFILAAPEDPALKTYSSRMGKGTVVFSPMGVPILAGPGLGSGDDWDGKSKKDKDKGKGKGKGTGKLVGPVSGAGVGTQDFALMATDAGQARRTSPMAPNNNPRYTGTTAVDSVPPPPHRNSNVFSGAVAEDQGSQVATDVSVWPIDDSEGNWYNARRIANVIMRGGGGKKKKVKAKQNKVHVWSNPERGMAMHYLA